MIPNPKKNAVVDFTLIEAKMAVEAIPAHFQQKYQLFARNDVFNQYTLSAFEFLSLGVYIDINLNSVSDTKTDIIVEVRRKVGAFDQWVEVQKANQHIAKLFEALSVLLSSARTVAKKHSAAVDVLNPSTTIKYKHPWEEVKQHIDRMIRKYPGTYERNDRDGDEVVLHRKPQGGDDVKIDRVCVLKIRQVGTNDGIIDVLFEATNEDNKITTQGELDRNSLIMKITINLIEKTFDVAPPRKPESNASSSTVAIFVVVLILIIGAAWFYMKNR